MSREFVKAPDQTIAIERLLRAVRSEEQHADVLGYVLAGLFVVAALFAMWSIVWFGVVQQRATEGCARRCEPREYFVVPSGRCYCGEPAPHEAKQREEESSR